MDGIVVAVLANADYFVLLLFRMAALVISSPLFGRVGVPQLVKTAFTLALTVLFFITFPPVEEIVYSTLIGFTLIVVSEVMIGIALGFVTNMFFSLAFTAGQLIDMQIGFGIVNVYDQQNNTQIPMVGNLYNIILLLSFFGVNAHHKLFAMIRTTLTRLPVGNAVFSPNIGSVALELFAKAFLMGVMVALPVIASGLILEITLGVLIRSVPQMNMFVVGIPIKIAIGFVLLIVCIPMLVNYSNVIFDELFLGVERMFATFIAL